MKTLLDAINLAWKLHHGQVDKAGQPYTYHPLRVMLSRRLTSDTERIAAVLHDTVEDCGITFEQLREQGYSKDVIDIIRHVTKLPHEEYDYDAFIKRVMCGPLGARRVKLADLDDNADLSRFKNPSDKDRNRQQKYLRAIARLESTHTMLS